MTWVRAILVLAATTMYFSSVLRLRPPLGQRWRFTPDVTPGWTFGLSGWLDPYFINALLEHWYHSVTTFSSPASPPMFFPARGTLGSSHGLVLFAPFYIVVRPFTDPFLANTLALFLVMLVGACSLYLVCRRLTLGPIESLLVSAFFWTSPNVVSGYAGVWTQNLSVFLIPPIALVAMIAADLRDGWPRLVLAWLAGLLAALLLIQDFYTAQFALLVGGLLLAGALLDASARAQVVAAIGRAWHGVRSTWSVFVRPTPALPLGNPHRVWLIVAGLASVVAAIAFVHPIDRTMIGPWRFSLRDPSRPLIVAIGAAAWYASRRWRLVSRVRSAMASASPLRPTTTSSTSTSTWSSRHRRFAGAVLCGGAVGVALFLWIYLGPFLSHPRFPDDQMMGGLWAIDPAKWHSLSGVLANLLWYEGARPFVLVSILSVLLWVPALNTDRVIRRYALWVVVVSAFVFVTPFKYESWSIWKLLVGWAPGLSSIRDPKRIIYVYELAVAVLVALLLHRLAPRSWLRLAAVALVAVLLVWERNATIFEFQRDRRAFHEWVEAPIAIDPSCRSFFIDRGSDAYIARQPGHLWSLYAIDSLFISMRTGIPTLNGYSAWVPDGWDLANPPNPDYLQHVVEWIALHDLRDVCRLDIDRRTMTPFQPPR